MKDAGQMVAEFHRKYGFQEGEELSPCPPLATRAAAVLSTSRAIRPSDGLGHLRAHLVLEEAAEMVQAIADGDRLALLDALADLAYVVAGTAVAYGLPLAEAFAEVHRSNMTKTASRSRDGHPDKGDGYSPPDLARVMKEAV